MAQKLFTLTDEECKAHVLALLRENEHQMAEKMAERRTLILAQRGLESLLNMVQNDQPPS